MFEDRRAHIQRQRDFKKEKEAILADFRDRWTRIKKEQKKEYRRVKLELEPAANLAPEAPEIQSVLRMVHSIRITRSKAILAASNRL
jgi:hypothetical protein